MMLKHKLHALGAVVTALLLVTFWSATLMSELFLTLSAIAQVKLGIAFAIPLLVVAMAMTAATGMSMGGKSRHPLLVAKRGRMPYLAVNGLLILVPSAMFLAFRASAGTFDTWFYVVQALELVAGAINITLIGLNCRDGIRVRRRHAPSKPGLSS